ncbi:MAG: hypothetical protein ACI4DQ_06485 [Lachnospiraceae bacterium]
MDEKIKGLNENSFLALVVGITILLMLVTKTFLPGTILMELSSMPNVAGICLIALLLNYYLGSRKKSNILVNAILGGIIFGMLPVAGGVTIGLGALKLALVGGVEYALLGWLFTSMTDRIECTINTRLAPIPTAFVLFLACQGLSNLLL